LTLCLSYKIRAEVEEIVELRVSKLIYCKRRLSMSKIYTNISTYEISYEIKNQQMSLIQFYSYIDGSLHVSGPQAHLQESSHICSHNHWFSVCTALVTCSTATAVNSCVNSPEDGPVGPKHVEIRRYMNKIELVTSVDFSFRMLKRCTVQKA